MNQKVAIAVEEHNNGTQTVAEHFGGCSKFNICELDENKNIVKEEEVFNPLSGEHGGNCQLPGFIKQFNVNTIIAGSMGQKAIKNFLNSGIIVITAPGLSSKQALDLFIRGELSGYESCRHEHKHHH
jgi:predicted Fe-Mo cluster-binding NifX family protein